MDKKGLTLVEIIVSTVIMALIMAGMSNIFIAGRRHLLHSRCRMTSAELGHYFLDPLQLQVRQDTWDTSCLKTGVCPEQTIGSAQGLDRNYAAQYNITSNFNNTSLSKVEVDIKWAE